MTSTTAGSGLITGMDVRSYFQDGVSTAIHNQQLTVSDATVVYVVNLLTEFTHSENLYESTPDGWQIKPLAGFYSEAISAEDEKAARAALKRLGDVALFISGLFAQSLQRSLVDIDYYIAMGGTAYDCLANRVQSNFSGRALSQIYTELAEQFAGLVDVLAEVADDCQPQQNQDLLRLYERWLLTGSEQAAGKLREQGIIPLANRTRH